MVLLFSADGLCCLCVRVGLDFVLACGCSSFVFGGGLCKCELFLFWFARYLRMFSFFTLISSLLSNTFTDCCGVPLRAVV